LILIKHQRQLMS